jgi:excisionase family DNA binding protein
MADKPKLHDCKWVVEIGAAKDEQRVYDAVRKNLIPHVRVGRRILFDERQIDEWLANGGSPLDDGGRHADDSGTSDVTAGARS